MAKVWLAIMDFDGTAAVKIFVTEVEGRNTSIGNLRLFVLLIAMSSLLKRQSRAAVCIHLLLIWDLSQSSDVHGRCMDKANLAVRKNPDWFWIWKWRRRRQTSSNSKSASFKVNKDGESCKSHTWKLCGRSLSKCQSGSRQKMFSLHTSSQNDKLDRPSMNYAII